jgi:hypothetical protein
MTAGAAARESLLTVEDYERNARACRAAHDRGKMPVAAQDRLNAVKVPRQPKRGLHGSDCEPHAGKEPPNTLIVLHIGLRQTVLPRG